MLATLSSVFLKASLCPYFIVMCTPSDMHYHILYTVSHP